MMASPTNSNKELSVRLLQIGKYRAFGSRSFLGAENALNVDMKIQFGRQKIQYQIDSKPPYKYRMDIPFEAISRISIGTMSLVNMSNNEITSDVPYLDLELNQPPTFWIQNSTPSPGSSCAQLPASSPTTPSIPTGSSNINNIAGPNAANTVYQNTPSTITLDKYIKGEDFTEGKLISYFNYFALSFLLL